MKELVKNPEKIQKIKERAENLVKSMTLEEKVFQMLHTAPAIERLGIKAYNWWSEGLHGVARAGTATVFPQAIAMAAAFDEEMMEQAGDAISTEARAKFNMQQEFADCDIYKGLTFWAPNVNIFRDPRWGRGHETYGEDPYLTGRLGVRFIEGMQGHDENYLKTAACAKHFAVHSGPEDKRHSFNAEVSVKDLYETYLPAFEACVKEARVEAVMGAYNRTNGEPCCGSKTLLSKILREDWGFDGHVTSDCWAIRDFHEHHHVTGNPKESAALAVKNGCDLNCGSLFAYLLDAVQEGLISEQEIDKSVARLFATRMKLGLLDQDQAPFREFGYELVDSPYMQEFNLKMARDCIVLLKNENNLLPLDKTKVKSIGVIGPNANNRRALVGNYEGTSSRYITVLEGIQDYLGDETRVYYSEGCHLYKDRIGGLGEANNRISEVKAICKEADVIIACLGLDPGLEGEAGDEGNHYASGDKPDLNLPGLQEELLKTIYESGKPVILVLQSGSALAVCWAEDHIPAILQGWYPGAQGGRAIAEAIFGEFSPSGRLPVTFYKSTGELPDFEDYSMKNRTYRYMKQEALFPFGFGLSYTTFQIEEAACESKELEEEGVTVSFTVKNTGNMAGGDVLQIYIKADADWAPNPQLKWFHKIYLNPGEIKKITADLPLERFSLYNEEGHKIILKGNYTLYVGDMQPDTRSAALSGKKTEKILLVSKQERILKK